jgi:hypothetical protein
MQPELNISSNVAGVDISIVARGGNLSI